MAVEKMKKISITTFHEYSERLLGEFQKSGTIHFKNLELQKLPSEYLFLSKKAPAEDFDLLEHKAVIELSLKALKPYLTKNKITSKRPRLTYEECCLYLYDKELKTIHEKIKHILEQKEDLIQEQKKIQSENLQLEQYTFIDFKPSDLKKFKKVKVLLISMKTAKEDMLSDLQKSFPELYLEMLGKVKQETVYLLASDLQNFEKVQGMLNQHSISVLELSYDDLPQELIKNNLNRLKTIGLEIDQRIEELKALAHMNDKFLIELDALNTVMSRNMVVNHFLASSTVLYMEGWVPEKNIPELYKLLDKLVPEKYFLESEDVVSDDVETPIKLHNKGIFSFFENITEMFSLPLYNELDPTSILTIFYLIFFGLMVGDVGYGLILTIGCFLGLRLIDFKEKMRKSVKMFSYIGISIILCGFLYGSIFGITFFTPIPAKDGGYKPILDTQTDIVFMLVLSMVIGMIHIYTGLILKGINCLIQKDYAGVFCDSILWILTLSSGAMFLLVGTGVINLGPANVYGIIFGICIAGLMVTQGRSSKTIGGKIGGGLYGVYGLTSYIGDIVSYTRIVALGLSGAYIAFSFNLMSGLIPGTFGKVVFGTLIAVFGQMLNFGLSLLGAYVHSCRLQYVEFFGKFFKGGGKAYKPFKVENEYVTMKKSEQENEL
jgi:V/A-type H+-transporting ATPase subunit I